MKANKYAKEVATLLNTAYAGDNSLAFSAAGIERKLPTVLRRPQCAAAMALGRMGDEGQAFADDIAKGLGDDMPTEVTVTLVRALGMMGKGPSNKICEMLQESSAPVREAACFALGEFDKSGDDVAGRLTDPHPAVRAAAATALGKMASDGPRHANDIVKLFSDKVAKVQIAA